MNKKTTILFSLLTACLGLFTALPSKAASLQLVTNNWGTNGVSTNVSMYVYVPDNVVSNPPVLVLLHYWGGTAASVFGQAQAGGIVAAADQYGFIMVVPQRSSDCWDYGSSQSLTHDGGGETHAIAQMVRYAITNYHANANRVYVTGDSCGGMMTEAMLAVYPDMFKAGVAFAGVPVGGQWTPVTHTAQEWGNLVRACYPGYSGPRPRVQLWHGTADSLVNYSNLLEATMQWGNVLGLNTNPTISNMVTVVGVTNQWIHQAWKNTNGATLLDTWADIGGDHGPSDALFKARYVIPFLGLDQVGPVDPKAYGQRGRPHLNAARTTFVADNGQPLRGPFTSTEWTSATTYDQIAKMKDLGFNAVHLYGESFDKSYPTNGSTAPGYATDRIDSIVQSTRDLGLYLVITIGNGAWNGDYNRAYITNFWNLYAARYANETHVLFEVQNEPVAWGPPYSSPTATPPGAVDMEVAAYNTIRQYAPNTPVLLFTYAVFSGSGGANAALTDIHAFNQAVFGNQNAVWTNEAVAFHGYGGWEGTASAVSSLINAGYPCFMTEFGWPQWGHSGGVALEVELTSDLERLGVSWLTFQYIPPTGVSSDVTRPELFKDPVDAAGLSWTPDYGTWPLARGVFGNGGQARETVANWVNNFLTGTVRIQAEDFDTGGEGVACHDTDSANTGGQYRSAEPVDIATCNDTGGGYKVTGTAAGEWMEYTILVREPGFYDLAVRYATPNSGCSVEAISSLGDPSGSHLLPPTGAFTTWATESLQVYLGYGRQRLRLRIPAGGCDLNWIELSPASTGIIANGSYKFLNGASTLTMTAVTSNSTVVASSYSGASVQNWNIQHMGGGRYKVTSVANGNSWSVSNDLLGLASSWNTGTDRNFIILPGSGGFYRLLPVSSGLSLNAASADASPVQQLEYSGSANQQWVIVSPSTPAFPTGLSATALSATQVALAWNTVSGATSYSVKRSTSSGGPYTTIAAGLAAPGYTDTVNAGMKYYYVVSAFSGASESPNSLEASVNPPYPWMSGDIGSVGVAGAVNFSNGVFTATGSGDDIWNAADAFRFVYMTNSGDCTITARVLDVPNTDGWAKAGVMIRSSLAANAPNAFMAVTPGNGVTWQTRSSTGGNTGNSAVSGLTAPYWVRLVRSGTTFTGYRSANGVTWTQQGSATISMGTTVYVGLAVTAHNNTKLCAATFDNVTFPGWANLMPPLAPTGLTAVAANGQVNLTWPASASATSYNVRRGVTDGGPYTFLANVSATNYTDTTVSNGVAHYYVVSAVNIAGESANSPQAGVSAQFIAPTGLTATPVSATQVHLVWNTFTDATSYNVKRAFESGGPYTTVATGVVATEFTDTTSAGLKYYYVVSAIAGGEESHNSAEATFSLPYPWLTQDVGLVGLAGSATISNGVFTAIGAGADIQGSADAFRYVYVPVTGNCTIVARVVSVQNIDAWSKAGVMIRESLNADAANGFVGVTPGNGVTWQDRLSTGGGTDWNNTVGLNAPYWVRLVRIGNTFTGYRSPDGVTWTQQGTATIAMATTVYAGLALTSHNSSSLCTATFDNVAAPGWSSPMPPSAPTGLAASAWDAEAILSWTGSAGAASYNIKRAATSGGPYVIVNNITATNFTDTGLTNGTNYYYVVSALNQAGESANSTETGVSPQLLMPTGLSAVAVSSGQINLAWNTLSNATSYIVKRSLTNGGSYVTIASGVVTTNYADSGLAGGTRYYYVVSAMLGGNETAESTQVAVATLSPTVGSLVHRYSFDESGGSTITDAVGGPVWNGTLLNGGTLAGGQLALSSSSLQYATLPAGIVNSMSNVTVMAWVNLASVTYWSRLFDFGNDATSYLYVTPRNGFDYTARFAISTSGAGGEQKINGNAAVNPSAWHQVAVSLNAGIGILYVDGEAIGTNSSLSINPSILGSTTHNYLGRSQSGSEPYYDGLLDEFRIYNAGLSAAEIAATVALGPDELLSTNRPAMSLTLAGTDLMLSWPLASAGFTLQSCTNLDSGDWQTVTSPAPQIVGGQWQVTLPPPGGSDSVFYRLTK